MMLAGTKITIFPGWGNNRIS